MIKFLMLLLCLSPLISFAEQTAGKHPRVLEVEDKLRDEASRYFARRYPGEPFFIKVDVTALRRDKVQGKDMESLPYLDYASEEMVDEWDDPTTPVSFLRNRVAKVFVEMAVPENFEPQKVTDIKADLFSYLKLLPYRDEVKVETRLQTVKTEPSFLPPYFWVGLSLMIGFSVLVAGALRWGFKSSISPQAQVTSAVAPQVSAQVAPSSKGNSKTNASVSGEVTFHDPLKTMDIIKHKLSLISSSGTFPTLRDMMTLHQFGSHNPNKLGGLIMEMAPEWQKEIFALGGDELWLEAFANPSSIDHESIFLLDKLSRERDFLSGDRQWENLLIHVWRMGDKSAAFVKRIDSEHAFFILSKLPKSLSLGIAKKAFPGSWGRLLDNKPHNVLVDSSTVTNWINDALKLQPLTEWKTLESYKKDKEILAYLDNVSIEDEKDIYETLSPDSFVFTVRPPFYKIFDLPAADFTAFVQSYPLDKWALAVMNSSRTYIKQITDQLDDKKKLVFSSHLRNLDMKGSSLDQVHCRKSLADAASIAHADHFKTHTEIPQEKMDNHAQLA